MHAISGVYHSAAHAYVNVSLSPSQRSRLGTGALTAALTISLGLLRAACCMDAVPMLCHSSIACTKPICFTGAGSLQVGTYIMHRANIRWQFNCPMQSACTCLPKVLTRYHVGIDKLRLPGSVVHV